MTTCCNWGHSCGLKLLSLQEKLTKKPFYREIQKRELQTKQATFSQDNHHSRTWYLGFSSTRKANVVLTNCRARFGTTGLKLWAITSTINLVCSTLPGGPVMVNAFPLHVSVVCEAFSILLNISSCSLAIDMSSGIMTTVDVLPMASFSTTTSASTYNIIGKQKKTC